MATELEAEQRDKAVGDAAGACPLERPAAGRFPALLSLAAIPGAILVNPVFFGAAGGLLATISLLLSPRGGRLIGILALAGSMAAAFAGHQIAS